MRGTQRLCATSGHRLRVGFTQNLSVWQCSNIEIFHGFWWFLIFLENLLLFFFVFDFHIFIFDEHMILSYFISTGGVARFLSSALIWLTAKINGRHHGLKLLKCLAMIRIHWMSKRPRVYFIPMRLWSKDLISWVFDLEHNLATSWAANWPSGRTPTKVKRCKVDIEHLLVVIVVWRFEDGNDKWRCGTRQDS